MADNSQLPNVVDSQDESDGRHVPLAAYTAENTVLVARSESDPVAKTIEELASLVSEFIAGDGGSGEPSEAAASLPYLAYRPPIATNFTAEESAPLNIRVTTQGVTGVPLTSEDGGITINDDNNTLVLAEAGTYEILAQFTVSAGTVQKAVFAPIIAAFDGFTATVRNPPTRYVAVDSDTNDGVSYTLVVRTTEPNTEVQITAYWGGSATLHVEPSILVKRLGAGGGSAGGGEGGAGFSPAFIAGNGISGIALTHNGSFVDIAFSDEFNEFFAPMHDADNNITLDDDFKTFVVAEAGLYTARLVFVLSGSPSDDGTVGGITVQSQATNDPDGDGFATEPSIVTSIALDSSSGALVTYSTLFLATAGAGISFRAQWAHASVNAAIYQTHISIARIS